MDINFPIPDSTMFTDLDVNECAISDFQSELKKLMEYVRTQRAHTLDPLVLLKKRSKVTSISSMTRDQRRWLSGITYELRHINNAHSISIETIYPRFILDLVTRYESNMKQLDPLEELGPKIARLVSMLSQKWYVRPTTTFNKRTCQVCIKYVPYIYLLQPPHPHQELQLIYHNLTRYIQGEKNEDWNETISQELDWLANRLKPVIKIVDKKG